MVSSHDRLFTPRKPATNRNARNDASCTISAASWSFPASQRARLYAASRCGSTSVSNWLCCSNSFTLIRYPYVHARHFYSLGDCEVRDFIPNGIYILRRWLAWLKSFDHNTRQSIIMKRTKEKIILH